MTHPWLDPTKYEMQPALLRDVLDYCPDDGTFIWRHNNHRPANWNGRYAGKCAGYVNHWGRRVIAIIGSDRKKRRYYASVLAWAWMTGEWPRGEVDHRDLNKTNDRWDNLRLGSHAQNKFNVPAPRDNTSGAKGVHFDKSRNKFSAQIQAFGVYMHLGRFDTFEAAKAAYAAAAAEHHGEFARTE